MKTMTTINTAPLAIHGGAPTVTIQPRKSPRWNDEERQALNAMIDQESLFYWKGPQTARLVKRFQEAYPLPHVMPCSSGTAAIHGAVAAIGLEPGDEVIVPPITDMGTLIGILYQQGVPVFADVCPGSYNIDPRDVERCITKRTKAILAVHLAGNPCDMTALKKIADDKKIALIEDCAQAWGAMSRKRPVGTIGDIGCFSLNDFKHIGCGDGGIVASGNEKYGPLLQKWCDKGYDRVTGSHSPDFLAPNYRISEPQAAIAAVQMTRLSPIVAARHRLGSALNEILRDTPGISIPQVHAEDYCSYWFYMCRLRLEEITCNRQEFISALNAEGVTAYSGYIPVPVYRYPVFMNANFFAGHWPIRELGLTSMDYRSVHCPNAEKILDTAFRIPIHQDMSEEFIRQVADAIQRVATHYQSKK